MNRKTNDGAGREAAAYLVSGVLSMAVSWAAMFGLNAAAFGGTAHPTPMQNAVLGLANWTSGMLAAYAMNRLWVFRSKAPAGPEFLKFTASRLATLGMDQALRQLMGAAGMDLYLTTVLLAVAVTVANYVLSKLAVFRKPGRKERDDD